MTEKNRVFFFFGQCMATVFFRLCGKLVKMKLLKFQKPVLIVYAIRESFFVFFFIFFFRSWENKYMPRRTFKVNSYHVLEIQTQYICLGLQPSVNCKSSSQQKKKERERVKPLKLSVWIWLLWQLLINWWV